MLVVSVLAAPQPPPIFGFVLLALSLEEPQPPPPDEAVSFFPADSFSFPQALKEPDS